MNELTETMLASELVLSREWDTPEEDEAWAGLEVKMEWTTETPTKAGYYWCWDGYDVWVCYLHDYGDGKLVYCITTDCSEPANRVGTHWIGPLPAPDAPEAKA